MLGPWATPPAPQFVSFVPLTTLQPGLRPSLCLPVGLRNTQVATLVVVPLSVGWSHQTEARAFQRSGGQDPTVRGGARLGYFQSLSSWLAASFFSKDLPTVVCLSFLSLPLPGGRCQLS